MCCVNGLMGVVNTQNMTCQLCSFSLCMVCFCSFSLLCSLQRIYFCCCSTAATFSQLIDVNLVQINGSFYLFIFFFHFSDKHYNHFCFYLLNKYVIKYNSMNFKFLSGSAKLKFCYCKNLRYVTQNFELHFLEHFFSF